MKEVLTLILAGGRGTRLEPLTQDRSKPAVPFGGAYRTIDKHVHVPDGARIGFDPNEDRGNGYTVTDSGIVVIPKARMPAE